VPRLAAAARIVLASIESSWFRSISASGALSGEASCCRHNSEKPIIVGAPKARSSHEVAELLEALRFRKSIEFSFAG